MKRVLLVSGILIALFVASTWWALESSGVAVLETQTPDGSTRSTHVWYAEPDGKLWLEAGTPTNAWYLDIQTHPVVHFSAPGLSGAYVATPVKEERAHDVVRNLLRQKYGLRDGWIAAIFDTSRSIAVALTRLPDDGHG